jgi:hypothetical protein
VTQKEKKKKKGCANLAKKFLRKNDPKLQYSGGEKTWNCYI